MKDFISIILVLTQLSVFVTTVQVYLRINKIWKRKHEEEVAASQSITGILLLIGNCVLWIFYYIWVETDMLSIVDTTLYLVESFVFLLISTGLWVKGKSSRNLWHLAKSALKLEKKESTYLLKKMFKPSNGEIIISILHQIAMIDDDLDPKEREIIEAFAKEWNINYSVDEMNKNRKDGDSYNFILLRDSMTNYLATNPPKEQALHMQSMIEALITADNVVSEEEELIQTELIGLIVEYTTEGKAQENKYSVLIVPQNLEHHEVVETIIPNTIRVNTSGGVAYSIGSYYSKKYAEMVCDQYRKINLFTIVYNLDNEDLKQ
ncbi:MAG: hypothetical protein WC121_08340 [Candidatus Kapaibacterium sp.]|jgi:hypothetical protein